jgi:signal transduction histidine kinase
VISRHGKVSNQPVVIQVARSEAPVRAELRRLALILVLGLPIGIATAGLGGYSLARTALAPVDRMAERARMITAERLSERLPVDHPEDELGRLATVFNETLGRLEASFEQMRRFTADVSHELRTPLTAIRSVGEVGLREPREPAEYRAIIGSMLEEVDRLSGLVDRLLALSRAESGQAMLSVEPVDLRALAEDVVSYLGVLAEEKGQTLTVQAAGAVRASADRLVLRQALVNLVDNAIKYTPPGGAVRVRVFDRYERGGRPPLDPVGGAGLGLAIARWAVEVNGGRLALAHSDDRGSTFRITLPRPVAPDAAACRAARAAGRPA